MTRFLLDTGIAGDYIHRRRGVYAKARQAITQGHRVGIGLPVLAELWFGVENSSSRDRNAERLRRGATGRVLRPLPPPGGGDYGPVAPRVRESAAAARRDENLISADRVFPLA